jgi:hypothetical protein
MRVRKAKGNESPFDLARPSGSALPRGNTNTSSFSSPLKASGVEHGGQRRPPAASEPRMHSMGPRGHHRAGQPSSPTASAPSRRPERTYESHADLPNPWRSAAALSSRVPTSVAPQGGQTGNPLVVDSSDDDVENGENDENLPPPRTAVDPDKRFESAGPPRATAVAPVTRAIVASSSSSRASRGQQANGHPSSRTLQFPRRASEHFGEEEDEEEEEEIGQFSSPNSPTEPRQSKGKGKASAPPARPHAGRPRQRMQDKNGNEANVEVSPVDMAELTQQARRPPLSKPASTTPQIPSSTGSIPGSVKAFYIESIDRPGQLTRLSLDAAKRDLVFILEPDKSRRIPFGTITSVTVGQVCVTGANPRLARTTASLWSSFSTKGRCGD